MIKNFLTKTRWLVTILLLTFCTTAVLGATTYQLTSVTSVSGGNKYVFIQNNRAMTTTGGDSIKTTGSYNTTGLAGTENYVWEVVATGTANQYKLRNVTANSGYYLRNKKSKGNFTTGLTTTNTDNQNIWSFSFSNGVATITNVESSRYLTFKNSYKLGYYAAASGGYGKSISVYLLEEEESCADPAAPSNSSFFLNRSFIHHTSA